MLASRQVNGRTLYVLDDSRVELKRGDKVLIETKDGATPAMVIRAGAFSFAVSRDGVREGVTG